MSPRIVLTEATENDALRRKVERSIAALRHERFWEAVQDSKQPKPTPEATSNVTRIRR
jgi:hypothetical protein